ncbi:hypothetical protein NX801_12380 [Streptomyces sp. LP05-1]|uniref:Uncharacterized protein n=1 Tax=Streptomyces pyxinae TaxID=2970734 RepID=A0ABT2CG96_9ACTN|nr:hypothetical protein [Streptomyces sp. LP05-1]MCS0636444.1 hypothetical protein [Streptomyces sp. LP05-1]
MNMAHWAVGLIVAVISAVAWRRNRYPGGWQPAFGRSYAPERRELARARRRLARRAVGAWAARVSLQLQLGAAEGERRSRIDTARRSLDEALRPGTGQVVSQLGALVLREHALSIGGDVHLPLTGLTVQIHVGIRSHHLTAVEGNGQVHHVPLDRDEHEENAVYAFAALIANTVLHDAAFRATRDTRVARARQRLADAEADTGREEAVQAELDQLIEEQRLDPERVAALARLKAACRRWETRTGRLPTR